MHSRTLAVVALLGIPMALEAQIRLPGRPRQGPAEAPPEAPGVARSTAYQRSRWTSDGYFSISRAYLPVGNDLKMGYVTFGSGTRSDYRLTENLSLGIGVTTSLAGDPSTTQTAEFGLRFRALPELERVRLFVDAAGAYQTTSSSFSNGGTNSVQFPRSEMATQQSRGAGGVAGAGGEFSLSDRLSVTTSVSALRSRQVVHHLSSGNAIPVGTSYWSTTYRLFVGLGYNFGRDANLPQNPTR